jgi:predicted nucleotidyltransferase
MNLLNQLFPPARAEIFRLLFPIEGKELHLRDLARQADLSVKSLQTELAKLSAADLVTSRTDGNRRYYRANSSHPLFADLRQIVLKTAGLRDVLAAALQPVPGIEVALVFGSVARDDSKGGSDVDLLVIGDAGLRALAPALRRASEQLGREINPVTFTVADYQQNRLTHPLLVDIANKEKLFVKGGPDELGNLG